MLLRNPFESILFQMSHRFRNQKICLIFGIILQCFSTGSAQTYGHNTTDRPLSDIGIPQGVYITSEAHLSSTDVWIHWLQLYSQVAGPQLRLQVWRPKHQTSNNTQFELSSQTTWKNMSRGKLEFNVLEDSLVLRQGDRIGFSWVGGCPVPYNADYSYCPEGYEPVRYNDASETLVPRGLYHFSVISPAPCRQFSMTVWLKTPGRKELTARSETAFSQTSNYPNGYREDGDEYWMISASVPGERVVVSVVDSALRRTDGCTEVYGQMRDGVHLDSPLLRQWCGLEAPGPVVSSGMALTIWFESGSGGIRRDGEQGFFISYRSAILNVDTTCFRLTGTSVPQILFSPGYPEFYFPNQDRCWKIKADDPNLRIGLQFKMFHTEGPPCASDYLEIEGGNAPLKLCGNEKPDDIITSGPTLDLRFISDDVGGFPGFYVTFRTAMPLPADCIKLWAHFTPKKLDNHGALPAGSNSSNVCWVVQALAPQSHHLELRLKNWQLAPATNTSACVLEALEIWDGSSYGSRLVTEICNSMSEEKTFTTTGSSAFVWFRSRTQQQPGGFQMEYVIKPSELSCTFLYAGRHSRQLLDQPLPTSITQSSGERCITIQASPSYDHVTCELTWSASVTKHDCSSLTDYVTIWDGPSSSDRLLGQFCQGQSGRVNSSSEVLLLHLYSTNPNFLSRLRLSYSVLTPFADNCVHIKVGESDMNLTSPGYPIAYHSYTSMCWVLESSSARLRLRMLHVKLQDSVLCSRDRVVIRDGPVENSQVLTTICGEPARIDDVTSSGANIFVEFITDERIESSGFIIQVVSLQAGSTLSESLAWLIPLIVCLTLPCMVALICIILILIKKINTKKGRIEVLNPEAVLYHGSISEDPLNDSQGRPKRALSVSWDLTVNVEGQSVSQGSYMSRSSRPPSAESSKSGRMGSYLASFLTRRKSSTPSPTTTSRQEPEGVENVVEEMNVMDMNKVAEVEPQDDTKTTNEAQPRSEDEDFEYTATSIRRSSGWSKHSNGQDWPDIADENKNSQDSTEVPGESTAISVPENTVEQSSPPGETGDAGTTTLKPKKKTKKKVKKRKSAGELPALKVPVMREPEECPGASNEPEVNEGKLESVEESSEPLEEETPGEKDTAC